MLGVRGVPTQIRYLSRLRRLTYETYNRCVNPTVLNRILLVLGYGGVFDAGVLSLAEVLHKEVPCGVDRGCAAVAADPSSHLLGVPNAYLGLAAYVVLAAFATYRELAGLGAPRARLTVSIGYAIAALGTIASIGLTFIAITQIHATCKWCLGSAAIMTLSLFAYMMLTLKLDAAPPKPASGATGMVMTGMLAFASLVGIGAAAAAFKTPNVDYARMTSADYDKLVSKDAHVKNPNGVVTLIEFGDLDCPTCKHTYPQIEQIVSNSKGKLRYVFHNYPLYQNPEHKGALAGAMISEIASEKGKFFDFLDMVYGDGKVEPGQPPPAADDMINFAQHAGLDVADIRKRLPNLEDPAFKRVQADLELTRTYNVNQTPYFMVIAPGMDTARVAGSGVFDVLEQPQYRKLLKSP